jgi:hypothetical protein
MIRSSRIGFLVVLVVFTLSASPLLVSDASPARLVGETPTTELRAARESRLVARPKEKVW